MRETASVEVAGEAVELLPERAVWWPGARTLVVADLHLGKEHSFAAVGIGLPGTVLDETLARLGRCVGLTGASRVIVVGDLLHAELGTTPEVVRRVADWRRGVRAAFVLVPGNHDRGAPGVAEEWGFDLVSERFEDGPFRFVHEPDSGTEDSYTWAGHLHPAVRLSGGRDSVRLPCFVMGERVGVLPAFSMFTGRATSAVGAGDRAWAIAADRVFQAPAWVSAGG